MKYMRLPSSECEGLLSQAYQQRIPYKISFLWRKCSFLAVFAILILGWLLYRQIAISTIQPAQLAVQNTIITTTTIRPENKSNPENRINTNDNAANRSYWLPDIRTVDSHTAKPTEATTFKQEARSTTTDKPEDYGNSDRKFEIRFKNAHRQIQMSFTRPCAPDTKMLILIQTRRTGFEERRGIRKTWINDQLPQQNHRFLIADRSPEGNETAEVQNELDKEQAQHGDLVFLHGLVDVYLNLNIKLYGGLLWQQAYCSQAEWMLKMDDDMVAHLARLDHWIEHKFRQIAEHNEWMAVFGLLMRNRPDRNKNHKGFYVPYELWPEEMYPFFMGGHAQLLTSKAIGAMLAQSANANLIQADDVLYSGMLADRANVTKSQQNQHFPMGTDGSKCEDGLPTAVTAHVGSTDIHYKKVPEYEQFYGQLKALQCPDTVAKDDKQKIAKNRSR